MKTVTMFETLDGEIHNTRQRAERHLDDIYGRALSKVAEEIWGMNAFKLRVYIDENADKFREILRIKQDFELDRDDDL